MDREVAEALHLALRYVGVAYLGSGAIEAEFGSDGWGNAGTIRLATALAALSEVALRALAQERGVGYEDVLLDLGAQVREVLGIQD